MLRKHLRVTEASVNSLSRHPTKWSNTLQHFVGNRRRLVWVDYFVGLVFKGFRKCAFIIFLKKFYHQRICYVGNTFYQGTLPLEADHTSSNFLKAIFHKFYLVFSWILWPIYKLPQKMRSETRHNINEDIKTSKSLHRLMEMPVKYGGAFFPKIVNDWKSLTIFAEKLQHRCLIEFSRCPCSWKPVRMV